MPSTAAFASPLCRRRTPQLLAAGREPDVSQAEAILRSRPTSRRSRVRAVWCRSRGAVLTLARPTPRQNANEAAARATLIGNTYWFARVRSEVGLQARQRGEAALSRRCSVLYPRTPTISTLETLPSEVGVMVGVGRIGHARISARFSFVRYRFRDFTEFALSRIRSFAISQNDRRRKVLRARDWIG